MIKFEVWYDAYQTKIMACSSEETKENNNVECYYKVGKYIKKEIEDIQEENNKQKEVLDKIKEWLTSEIKRLEELQNPKKGIKPYGQEYNNLSLLINAYDRTLDELNKLLEEIE